MKNQITVPTLFDQEVAEADRLKEAKQRASVEAEAREAEQKAKEEEDEKNAVATYLATKTAEEQERLRESFKASLNKFSRKYIDTKEAQDGRQEILEGTIWMNYILGLIEDEEEETTPTT